MIVDTNLTLSQHHEKKEALTERVRKVLNYTGWALTGVFAVVYLILLTIIMFGFSVKISINAMLIIATIGAIFTFAITSSMMYQGILFAKSNKEVNALLVNLSRLKALTRNKKKRPFEIGTYIATSSIINLLFKSLGVAVMTYCMINFTIIGVKDIMIIWLGVSNVMIAIGFGLISLVSSYDTYVEKYIPTIKVRINELEEQLKPSGVDTTKKE